MKAVIFLLLSPIIVPLLFLFFLPIGGEQDPTLPTGNMLISFIGSMKLTQGIVFH